MFSTHLSSGEKSGRFLKPLYASTLFLGAFLLFLLEPLFAKRILPWFGGSSSVWTTCLVFFQAALLLGYLYADLITCGYPVRFVVNDGDEDRMVEFSQWVLVTRNPGFLGEKTVREASQPIGETPGLRPWTDSDNNLFQILRPLKLE